ncbi:hypothetical protein ACFE04_011163 [Oxalis oulophora]
MAEITKVMGEHAHDEPIIWPEENAYNYIQVRPLSLPATEESSFFSLGAFGGKLDYKTEFGMKDNRYFRPLSSLGASGGDLDPKNEFSILYTTLRWWYANSDLKNEFGTLKNGPFCSLGASGDDLEPKNEFSMSEKGYTHFANLDPKNEFSMSENGYSHVSHIFVADFTFFSFGLFSAFSQPWGGAPFVAGGASGGDLEPKNEFSMSENGPFCGRGASGGDLEPKNEFSMSENGPGIVVCKFGPQKCNQHAQKWELYLGKITYLLPIVHCISELPSSHLPR